MRNANQTMFSNRASLGAATCAAALLLVGLSGCLSQQTVGDRTRFETDNEMAIAAQLRTQYSPKIGQYQGNYDTSTVVLTLDVSNENATPNNVGDGIVPQPTIVGNLTFMPELFVTDQGQPMRIPFAVTSGQYAEGDLSLNVLEGGTATNLHCTDADESGDTMDCRWYVAASSAPYAEFTLSRVQKGQAVSSAMSRAFGGTYTGHSDHYYRIDAQFQTIYVPEVAAPGSQGIPIISVVGNFVKYDQQSRDDGVNSDGVNYPFRDAEYDPITNTLAINIAGSNPIVVNCLIKTPESLHCTWIGKHGAASYEDFDLEKVN